MDDPSSLSIDEHLRVEFGLCPYCISLVVADDGGSTTIANPSEDSDSCCNDCSLCFGLSSPTYQQHHIVPLIIKSLAPYCTGRGNYLTKESPTLNVPMLIAVRAQCAIAAAECYIKTKETNADTAAASIRLRSAEEVYSKLKEYLRSSIREVIEKTITHIQNGDEARNSESQEPNLSQQLHEEESGYLAAHVLLLPEFLSKDPEEGSTTNISHIIPPSLQSHIIKNKHQIDRNQHRILNPRKRFRGNDPTLKQGGEPRTNLELRVRRSMNQPSSDDLSKIVWLEKTVVLDWLKSEIECKESSLALSSWLHETKTYQIQPCINVGVWRRQFYIKGTYTKSRRDVAQSPFFVSDANGLVRKGVSSVEEEICPHLANCCGGISNQNNEHVLVTANGEAVVQDGSVVYGCCKFHASGREDIDVRMLLPPPSTAKSSSNSNNITGRPFVCEIFDALLLPTVAELDTAMKAINHNQSSSDDDRNEEMIIHDINNDWPQSLVGNNRFHGSNPNGVGVSSSLQFTSSSSFSGLQGETEEKVKHYGCICWTSVIIRSDKELREKLGCLPWDQEKNSDYDCTNFPLEIKQDTPLRVLHRRSSDTRTRHVLSLSACRIDDHWIRLRMATSAGTYVKEFCHGDCGRTQPSISSLLGGRVDITELDCEGIEM